VFADKMHVTKTQAIMLLTLGVSAGKRMHERAAELLPKQIVNPITLQKEQNPERQRLIELSQMDPVNYYRRAEDIFIDCVAIRHPLKIVQTPKREDFLQHKHESQTVKNTNQIVAEAIFKTLRQQAPNAVRTD